MTLIKKSKNWKIKLLLALSVALLMEVTFFIVSASASTIVQIHYPSDGNDFTSYSSVPGRFRAPTSFNDINYTNLMATGTMSTYSTNWRYIEFGGFSSTTPYQLQLYTGVTPGTGQILDCLSDANAIAGDYIGAPGIAQNVTFTFTGSQCELSPYLDYGFIIAGGSDSGASQQGNFNSTTGPWTGTHKSILIADLNGPTNPDLLLPETPVSSPLDFDTRLIEATAQGNSSTSVSFTVDYVLNTSEYTANTRPDYITTQILDDSGQQITSTNKLILPLSDGFKTTNVPTSYAFPDGDYISYFHFWNINSNSITFEQTGLVVSFTISGGSVVNSDLLEQYDGLELSDQLTYEDCSITNVDGCLKNALIFTFVPTPGAFDKFTTLYTKIETKPPFGYVTSLKNALSGLNSNSTSAFDFGAIPFQATIFDPFKAIMIIGLWLLYTLFFMGRVNKLDV